MLIVKVIANKRVSVWCVAATKLIFMFVPAIRTLNLSVLVQFMIDVSFEVFALISRSCCRHRHNSRR